MRDFTIRSILNKFVPNCQFVRHAKFPCQLTTLTKLFKIEFDRGAGKEAETGKEPKYFQQLIKRKFINNRK